MAKSKKVPGSTKYTNRHIVSNKKRKDSRSIDDFRLRRSYSRIVINGFRSFDSVVFDSLGDINLILGPNNSGKTSVLEAVFAHACGLNFGPFRDQVLLLRHNATLTGQLDLGEKLFSTFRRTDQLPFQFNIEATERENNNKFSLQVNFAPSAELAELDPRNLGQMPFAQGDLSGNDLINSLSNIEISGLPIRLQTQTMPRISLGIWSINLSGNTRKIDVSFPPVPLQSVHPFKLGNFQDILSHRAPEAEPKVFGQLKRYGVLDQFVSDMKRAFPTMREIDMIPLTNGRSGSLLVTTHDGKRLPLFAFGDGVRRWYHMLGNMHIYQNAIHCIEEIDATFHPGSQAHLSRLLLSHTKEFSNQIFATSHSIEYIDCFLDAFYGPEGVVDPNDPDPVRIFTLRTVEDRTEVWSLSGREAYESRDKFKIELRV
jgi:hypothetical protein